MIGIRHAGHPLPTCTLGSARALNTDTVRGTTMPTNFQKDRNLPVIAEFKARTDVLGLMRRHGAHSVGIAPKVVDGESTDKLALVFYVAAKRSSDDITEFERIPDTFSFVQEKSRRTRRVTTDVVESPPASFEVDPETRIRPVPGGVSGGINGSTGTIGGWVWDNTDDSIVMLSNHHVFGHTAGTDILQQGTADGGSLPADKIGDVKRGIVRTSTGTNTVDAAIGDPDDDSIYDLSVLEIGPAVYATDTATFHMEVEKFGQTTEHTFGRIISTNYSTLVSGTWFFDDCLRIEPISPSSDWSDGGDSGSIVFRQEPTTEGGTIKPAVGLHFAGGGIYGVACKIENVFADLDLDNLCSGAFSNFLDSMNETEEEFAGRVSMTATAEASLSEAAVVRPGAGLTTRDLRGLTARPVPSLVARPTTRAATFSAKVRGRASALNPVRGLSRDVQSRLKSTSKGRKLTDAVDTHRGELLTMLAKDGDVRRAAVSALRPVTKSAVTSDDVLRTVLTDDAIERFDRLADTVTRKASPQLRNVIGELRDLASDARGATLGQLFGLDD